MIGPAIVVLLLAAPSRQQQTPADLYKKVLPSLMSLSVQKTDGNYVGTAFLIEKKGIAATAWHVIAGARVATAKFSDGQEYDVSGVIDKDEKRDIAIIRVKIAGRPYLELSPAEPVIGTKAYAIGSPEGLDFSFSEGMVSQLRTLNDRRMIQFTSPVSHGSSGGPLLDETGKVIGVVDSGIEEGENLNFAVPSMILAGLDESLPTQPFDSVKTNSSSTSAPILDPDKLGLLTWDGRMVDKRGYDYNLWSVLGLYHDNAPAIPENIAIGLACNLDGRLDTRGISVTSLMTLCHYMKEFLDQNTVPELKYQQFNLVGKRFVIDKYVFSDRPVHVWFVHRGGSAFTRPRWSIDLQFEGDTRSMDQGRARAFLAWVDELRRAFKTTGVDLDQIKD